MNSAEHNKRATGKDTLPPASAPARPPSQPLSGPGGAEYPHSGFTQQRTGRGGEACWVFIPDDPLPTEAPVTVFFHGWSGVHPVNYGQWIVHLVRKGHIVLYPVYQDSFLTPLPRMAENASRGLETALAGLEDQGPLRPRRDQVVLAGHSLGGYLALETARRGYRADRFEPRALALIQPGWGKMEGMDLETWRDIPRSALALVMVGDEDVHLPADQPRAIYGALAVLPEQNRNFIRMRSDRYGRPPLVADHSAPLSERTGVGHSLSPLQWLRRERGLRDLGLRRRRADTLDYYGHWKLLDALGSAALYGRDRAFALGNTPEQRFMGRWSDGVPVKELEIRSDPREIAFLEPIPEREAAG